MFFTLQLRCKTYYCDVKVASWESVGNQLVFTIKADRFLRNMVRAIVGTLLDVGFEKTSLSEFHEIIKAKTEVRQELLHQQKA